MYSSILVIAQSLTKPPTSLAVQGNAMCDSLATGVPKKACQSVMGKLS